MVIVDDDYDEHDPAQVAAHIAAEDRINRLMINSKQLAYTLTVDRNTPYFPGETMKVEIVITNPTALPLEIPNPNDPETQCFTGHVEEWCSPQFLPLNVQSMTIQPGQVITLTVDSEDKAASKRWGVVGASTVPQKYGFRYLLGGSVEFEVEKPLLEASALVPLHTFTTLTSPSVKQPRTEQDAAMIVAVQLAGEHVILVGKKDGGTTFKIKAENDGTFKHGTGLGAPWIRLATVSSKITEITATTDADDRITLKYATANGTNGTIYLDKNRHPL